MTHIAEDVSAGYARVCVSTRGDVVHVFAHSKGRARKPSSNSRTGDLECWAFHSKSIIYYN